MFMHPDFPQKLSKVFQTIFLRMDCINTILLDTDLY